MIARTKAAMRLTYGDKVLTEHGWREVKEVSFGNYLCDDGIWFEDQPGNPAAWPRADVTLAPDQEVVVL